MKIALTGGIGSGKSFICRELEKRGIRVYDCDAGAKRLMRDSSVIVRQLTALIGKDAYVNGTPNKAKIAQFLLQSEANKLAINHIVHPEVIRDFYSSGLDWMESAIIFEAHLEHTVDRIVCVTAPEDVRVQRIMERDSIPHDRAVEWIRAQMPQEEAVRRSHYVIINDGKADVRSQVTSLLQSLQEESHTAEETH